MMKVSQYSLGMKQRLAIARAILAHPQLLILDEPINALDPQGIVEMRNLFRGMRDEFGMTILISSHILSEVEHIADRIGIIQDGRIVKEINNGTYQEEYIKLTVKNHFETQEILRKKNIKYIFKENKYFLINPTEISIGDLSVLMIQNNIALLGISMVKQDLEDYFFDTIIK